MSDQRTAAAYRILDIGYEIKTLLDEARRLVRENSGELTQNRAESYWYPHILMSLSEDHGYLGGSMCTMEDSAREILSDVENEGGDE